VISNFLRWLLGPTDPVRVRMEGPIHLIVDSRDDDAQRAINRLADNLRASTDALEAIVVANRGVTTKKM
jgi:hypothetical protein